MRSCVVVWKRFPTATPLRGTPLTIRLVTPESLFLQNYRYRYRLEIRMNSFNYHYRYRRGVRSHPFISIDSQLPS